VSFGVRTMRCELGGDGVHFILQAILNTVQLFRKHLVSFSHELELVLKILGENADMVLKVLIDVFSVLYKLGINDA